MTVHTSGEQFKVLAQDRGTVVNGLCWRGLGGVVMVWWCGGVVVSYMSLPQNSNAPINTVALVALVVAAAV